MKKYAKVYESGDVENMLVDTTNEVQLELARSHGFLPLVEEASEVDLLTEEELGIFGSVENRYRTEVDRVVKYRERVENSPTKVGRRIATLQLALDESDYRVVRALEHVMVGTDLDFDIVGIHDEREALREEIRELKRLLPLALR